MGQSCGHILLEESEINIAWVTGTVRRVEIDIMIVLNAARGSTLLIKLIE